MVLDGYSSGGIRNLDPVASAQARSPNLKERWLRRVSARRNRRGRSLEKASHPTYPLILLAKASRNFVAYENDIAGRISERPVDSPGGDSTVARISRFISVFGSRWASLDLSDNDVGVILIGRGAPCAETGEQITVSCISRETRPERILVSPNDSIGPVPPLRQVHPRP